MPSFYIPNRYRAAGEIAAYLQGCVDGLVGRRAGPDMIAVALTRAWSDQAYAEGYRKGASLRELDL